jgi:hypothetical protein
VKRAFFSAAIAAALALGATGSAVAEDYNTKRLKYENKGGYSACTELHWKDSQGNKHKLTAADLDGDQCPPTQQSRTINLNDLTGTKKPSVGDEVWLVIKIDAGDTETCRKDNARFYYDSSGGTATFKTKGTTLQNNRCRIVCKSC